MSIYMYMYIYIYVEMHMDRIEKAAFNRIHAPERV